MYCWASFGQKIRIDVTVEPHLGEWMMVRKVVLGELSGLLGDLLGLIWEFSQKSSIVCWASFGRMVRQWPIQETLGVPHLPTPIQRKKDGASKEKV